MKLKINDEYYCDEDGNPVEFDMAIKYLSKSMVKLFVNAECICTFGGIKDFDAFTLEDGDWTDEPMPERDLILAEAETNAFELYMSLQE